MPNNPKTNNDNSSMPSPLEEESIDEQDEKPVAGRKRIQESDPSIKND